MANSAIGKRKAWMKWSRQYLCILFQWVNASTEVRVHSASHYIPSEETCKFRLNPKCSESVVQLSLSLLKSTLFFQAKSESRHSQHLHVYYNMAHTHTLFCHALRNKSSIHNLSTTHSWKVVITLYMHKNQTVNLNDLLKATKQVGG